MLFLCPLRPHEANEGNYQSTCGLNKTGATSHSNDSKRLVANRRRYT
nr:MAG TPA: hypothetical protein [Caudoviricetes sp.]